MYDHESFYGGILIYERNNESGEVVAISGVDVNPPKPTNFVLPEEEKIAPPGDISDRDNAGVIGVVTQSNPVTADGPVTAYSVWADFNHDEWWTVEEGDIDPDTLGGV